MMEWGSTNQLEPSPVVKYQLMPLDINPIWGYEPAELAFSHCPERRTLSRSVEQLNFVIVVVTLPLTFEVVGITDDPIRTSVA